MGIHWFYHRYTEDIFGAKTFTITLDSYTIVIVLCLGIFNIWPERMKTCVGIGKAYRCIIIRKLKKSTNMHPSNGQKNRPFVSIANPRASHPHSKCFHFSHPSAQIHSAWSSTRTQIAYVKNSKIPIGLILKKGKENFYTSERSFSSECKGDDDGDGCDTQLTNKTDYYRINQQQTIKQYLHINNKLQSIFSQSLSYFSSFPPPPPFNATCP